MNEKLTSTDNESSTRTDVAAPPETNQSLVAGVHSKDAMRVGDLKKPRRENSFLNAFLPNRIVSGATMKLIIIVEALIALAIWFASPFKVLPQPGEVLSALQNQWMTQGLGQELAISFGLNLQALAWATAIAMLLSYLTVIPVFRPIVAAISKGRFLSLAGFTLIFTLFTGGGHALKTSLLVFSITVFYITSMASVIAAIPKGEFDHARTLRMSEWRVVWEVVILGTAEKAFEVLRQNAAIGWMMLTMVEGIVRGEGGIGTALLDVKKHFILADVFAIQLVILLVGMFQDYFIGLVRRVVCPYADITLERK